MEEIYSNKQYDFSDYEKNASGGKYVVKCQTGAELENSWGNDDASTTSFEDRIAKNSIRNVLVSRERYNWKPSDEVSAQETPHLPFYSFGDLVKKSVSNSAPQFCIKEAYDNYLDDESEEKKKALFLCMKDDNSSTGVKISEPAAATILYQMILAIGSYKCNIKYPELTEQKGDAEDVVEQKKAYNSTAMGIYTTFEMSGGLESNALSKYFKVTLDMREGIIEIFANFEMGPRKLTYNYNKGTYTFEVPKDDITNLSTLKVCSYDDDYCYQESYSLEDTDGYSSINFNTDASPLVMRTILKRAVGNFLSKCEGL